MAKKRQAAKKAASKDAVGCTTKKCKLKDIIAYDIEGHYIGTKPPVGDDAYLSTKEVVDAHRDGEKVDLEAILADPATKYLCKHHDLLRLAATAYGEASVKDVYEEIAGIAYVLVRQMKARGYSDFSSFLTGEPTFAFAASDGNARYAAFKPARPDKVDMREGNDGMRLAIKGAINAILERTDYSNGAYFWDGRDIATNNKKHFKIRQGYKFTAPEHRIFNVGDDPIGDSVVPHTVGKKSYDYTYETTAVWGDTIFSKFTSDFMGATGNKPYK
jgi:hypothetical protein